MTKIIILSLILVLSSQLHSFEMPGIYAVQYQQDNAFTDRNNKVYLVATVIDMGGSTTGLGEALSTQQVMQNIGRKINSKPADKIVKTPLQGIYALYYDKQVLYVDGTGRYMFRNGRLVTSTGVDLTAKTQADAAKMRAKKNLEWLSPIADEDMLVYPARREQSSITIFTDVDCVFCRRIHRELPTYTKAGITVKYLFYPRAGRQSIAYNTFVSVWCNENPYAALEKVEIGQHIATKVCKNPVEQHLLVAEAFGLMGTPIIILQDGTMISGYKAPDELIPLALNILK